MGASKTYQYSISQNQFAQTAKAVGHPARVAIMEFLALHGIGTLKDLMAVTLLTDATVSQHLRELVQAGLVDHFWLKEHYWRMNPGAKKQISDLVKVLGTRALKK